MEPMIQIFCKSPNRGREFVCCKIYLDSDSSGTLNRIQQSKGIFGHTATRKATEHEINYHKDFSRIVWESFYSWESLIATEWTDTEDEIWCRKLISDIKGPVKSFNEIMIDKFKPEYVSDLGFNQLKML